MRSVVRTMGVPLLCIGALATVFTMANAQMFQTSATTVVTGKDESESMATAYEAAVAIGPLTCAAIKRPNSFRREFHVAGEPFDTSSSTVDTSSHPITMIECFDTLTNEVVSTATLVPPQYEEMSSSVVLSMAVSEGGDRLYVVANVGLVGNNGGQIPLALGTTTAQVDRTQADGYFTDTIYSTVSMWEISDQGMILGPNWMNVLDEHTLGSTSVSAGSQFEVVRVVSGPQSVSHQYIVVGGHTVQGLQLGLGKQLSGAWIKKSFFFYLLETGSGRPVGLGGPGGVFRHEPSTAVNSHVETELRSIAATARHEGGEVAVQVVVGVDAFNVDASSLLVLGNTTVPGRDVSVKWQTSFSTDVAGVIAMYDVDVTSEDIAVAKWAVSQRDGSGQDGVRSSIGELDISHISQSVEAEGTPGPLDSVVVACGGFVGPKIEFGPPSTPHYNDLIDPVVPPEAFSAAKGVHRNRIHMNSPPGMAVFYAGFSLSDGAPKWINVADTPAWGMLSGTSAPTCSALTALGGSTRVYTAISFLGRGLTYSNSASQFYPYGNFRPSADMWKAAAAEVNNTVVGSNDMSTENSFLLGFDARSGSTVGASELVAAPSGGSVVFFSIAAPPVESTEPPQVRGSFVAVGDWRVGARFGDLLNEATDPSQGGVVLESSAPSLYQGIFAFFGPLRAPIPNGNNGNNGNNNTNGRPVPPLPQGVDLVPVAIDDRLGYIDPRTASRNGGLVLGYVMFDEEEVSGVAVDHRSLGQARRSNRDGDRLSLRSPSSSEGNGTIYNPGSGGLVQERQVSLAMVPLAPPISPRRRSSVIPYSTGEWFFIDPLTGALILREEAPELDLSDSHVVPIRISPRIGSGNPDETALGRQAGGHTPAEIHIDIQCIGDSSFSPLRETFLNAGKIEKVNIDILIGVVTLEANLSSPRPPLIDDRSGEVNGGGDLPWRNPDNVGDNFNATLFRDILADRLGIFGGPPESSQGGEGDDFGNGDDDELLPPLGDDDGNMMPSPSPSPSSPPPPSPSASPSSAPPSDDDDDLRRRLANNKNPLPSRQRQLHTQRRLTPSSSSHRRRLQLEPEEFPYLALVDYGVAQGIPPTLEAGAIVDDASRDAYNRFLDSKVASLRKISIEFAAYARNPTEVRTGQTILIDVSNIAVPSEENGAFVIEEDGTFRRRTGPLDPSEETYSVRDTAKDELHSKVVSQVLASTGFDTFWATRRLCFADATNLSPGHINPQREE